MRAVARVKLGYYPLPPAEGERIRTLLQLCEGVEALDPCAGTGAALLQITEGSDVRRHGVELDANRASMCEASGIHTIHGNLFDVHAKSGAFSLLYLNPPYDSEVTAFGNRRMETLFLQKTHRWLAVGGILIMVVPHERLQGCVDILAEAFTEFSVYRLTDPECERFDQVVLFAVRTRVKGADYEQNRARLLSKMWSKELPHLTGDEAPYSVPSSAGASLECRGISLDEAEDAILASSAWTKVRPFLSPGEELSVGRPITPLHSGHVGLLCTAGLLNGVFGTGADRHIARWRSVKYITTFEERIDGFTEVHKRERFSNELALIYEDGRTLILTDEKKETHSHAERTPQTRAA